MKITIMMLLSIFTMQWQVTAQWNKVKDYQIEFIIKNAGFNVSGSFNKADVHILIDEANPANSSFLGVVQANSVRTGIDLRDTHLKEKAAFFDVQKYPTLTMKSVSVSQKSTGLYSVTWDLTMKGITRRFNSVVSAKVTNDVVNLSTEVKVNRMDWKVGDSSLMMSDYVTIKLKATVSK